MEIIADNKEKEERKIFAELKIMFAAGKGCKRFRNLIFLRISTDLNQGWDSSSFNYHHSREYFTMFVKKINGELTWIAVANLSKRQYRLVMK